MPNCGFNKVALQLYWNHTSADKITNFTSSNNTSNVFTFRKFKKLPNDLRLRILGNEKISGKCLNFIEW